MQSGYWSPFIEIRLANSLLITCSSIAPQSEISKARCIESESHEIRSLISRYVRE